MQPGVDRHALLLAIDHDVRVKAGADDELSARFQRLVHLGGGENGAGAHQHLGLGLAHQTDGGGSARGAEGHFRHRQPALAQGRGQRGGVTLGVVQFDDRHDADLGNALGNGIHTYRSFP